jgi:hypothetical protein
MLDDGVDGGFSQSAVRAFLSTRVGDPWVLLEPE